MSDYNQNPWGNQGPSYRPRSAPANNMAVASIVCAVLAVVTACTVYGAVFFGALAIVFGCLSRGAQKKAPKSGRLGLRIGIIAIVASLALCFYSFYTVKTEYGSIENFMRENAQILEEFGIDPDEYMDSFDSFLNINPSSGSEEYVAPESDHSIEDLLNPGNDTLHL